MLGSVNAANRFRSFPSRRTSAKAGSTPAEQRQRLQSRLETAVEELIGEEPPLAPLLLPVATSAQEVTEGILEKGYWWRQPAGRPNSSVLEPEGNEPILGATREFDPKWAQVTFRDKRFVTSSLPHE
jgi:hypothetical protein